MSISFQSGRAQAVVSWGAAALLLSLILWLSGALPLGAFDDVLSVGAAASGLVVFVLISGEVRKYEPWASVTLALGITGMTLVLAGDALQHAFFHSLAAGDPNKGTIWVVGFALRDWLGNGLFYASLILLGGLLVGEGRRWVGALAIANGVLGYLDLAFASTLGLPPHTNFLLLVVWEVVLGFTWWRLGSRVDAVRPGLMADREQTADDRGMQAGESTARI
ncbi:MAG TPA: hypothetical protein VKR06_14050 [Ktedonosporobacter sp.]|nr:hypothetical protein [Ktedonosporobacter sp.]